MKGDIPLHPTRGLDPHLTTCPLCGGDHEDLVVGHTLRAIIRKYGDPSFETTSYYTKGHRRAFELQIQNQDRSLYVAKSHELEDGEKVVSSEPCRKCSEELKTQLDLVKAGGVFFRCDECKREGVIKASAYTHAVREKAGILPPEPVGVQFHLCVEHRA